MQPAEFTEFYDRALPHVYGYLARRCESVAVAEDVTAEVFMAAVRAIERKDVIERIDIAWLMVTARHKLIDHWRRSEREREALTDLLEDLTQINAGDEPLDATGAHETLMMLAPSHRAVLTLRYLDGRPVGEVAATIGRSLHATEALLTRAKSVFRSTHATMEEAT